MTDLIGGVDNELELKLVGKPKFELFPPLGDAGRANAPVDMTDADADADAEPDPFGRDAFGFGFGFEDAANAVGFAFPFELPFECPFAEDEDLEPCAELELWC